MPRSCKNQDSSPPIEAIAAWLAPWIANAEQMANSTVLLLDRLGIKPSDKGLSKDFLLEISAIARLAEWERAEIRERIDCDLPTAADAMADLVQRLKSADRLPGGIGTPLLKRVLQAWASRCARQSRLELGVDIVLDPPELDILLDQLAKILWTHRHLILDTEDQHE